MPSRAHALSLPNFFLAGAPKAGTTSLYRYLGQHPQVFVSPVKEPGFFAAAELRGWTSDRMRAAVRRNEAAMGEFLGDRSRRPPMDALTFDWDTYLALFADAGDALAIGEGSTVYWWAHSAASAIHARVPAARVLVLLRDPAERFHSQVLAESWSDPVPTLRDRMRAALARTEPWGPALDAGCYATHLERFLAVFPRRQLHIVLHEELRDQPHDALRGIFEFLGVDPHFRGDVSTRENVPVLPRVRWVHALRRRLLGGRSLTRLLPAPASRMLQSVYRAGAVRPSLAAADRAMLVEFYRSEIERTSALLGRDLGAWLRPS